MSTPARSLDSIHSPNVSSPIPLRMTEDEFVAWCDEETKAEWVDGEVIMMSPANLRHIDLQGWLASLLRHFVERNDLGVVFTEAQTRFEALRRRRVPDIVFVSAQRAQALRETHIEGPPDLAIEIVSPDSEARDWREKYLEYQTAGVREYWVIDLASRHVEAYALMPDDESGAELYRLMAAVEGVIVSQVLDGFWIKTDWLWPDTRPKLLDAVRELGLLDEGGGST